MSVGRVFQPGFYLKLPKGGWQQPPFCFNLDSCLDDNFATHIRSLTGSMSGEPSCRNTPR